METYYSFIRKVYKIITEKLKSIRFKLIRF